MRDLIQLILSIQELDVKMMRLMRVKKQRLDELKELENIRKELLSQLEEKQTQISSLDEECTLYERKISEHEERVKKLESQQTSIKKIDEFNALTKEITSLEREKASFEQTLSNLVDEKSAEEELLEKTKETLAASEESNKEMESEISVTVEQINKEGLELKQQRDKLSETADPEILRIYDRLVRNKRDRVLVPIEGRICSGCHIALTAQHENLVRRAEKLIFCEHCSRIHYWPEDADATEAGEAGKPAKRRRRRSSV